jgi:toxin HigB-1
MILSFVDRETEKLWSNQSVRRMPADVALVAKRKLRQLNAVTALKELRIPPGNRPEALKDSRKGQYSIRINDQWRICFEWTPQGARHVEIIDYH